MTSKLSGPRVLAVLVLAITVMAEPVPALRKATAIKIRVSLPAHHGPEG